MRVYIAGPYTKGDVAQNVRNAIEAGDRLFNVGFTPFIPHLTHFWHLLYPHRYETWLALDLQWLRQCDVILRLPGDSSGADKEVAYASDQLHMPVYYDIDELIEQEAT